jgi:sulfate adenylyltransferase subunit 1 (EFTu-like GTPase family)
LLYAEALAADKMRESGKASARQGRETEFAYLLDHLEEERRQSRTIDTTQVFLDVGQRRYVIIDAPGHAEFLQNMMTGATQAEAAVLIVDAAEGLREQTRRHACMLALLGLRQMVVVINKMDLVGFDPARFRCIRQHMAELLESAGLEPSFYVPISALRGDNIAARSARMEWYRGPTFLEALAALPGRPPPLDKPLLVSIQDAYQIGDRWVNVGRVEAGVLRKGLTIRVLPSGRITQIASIDKFQEAPESAMAGECVGLTTADATLLDRGDVVCRPGQEPPWRTGFRRLFSMTGGPRRICRWSALCDPGDGLPDRAVESGSIRPSWK